VFICNRSRLGDNSIILQRGRVERREKRRRKTGGIIVTIQSIPLTREEEGAGQTGRNISK
jgi:hypothetical protein